MTEGTKTTSQEILERLHAARGELDELLAEQRGLSGDLEQARVEDHAARMEAVRDGGSIRSAVSSVVSRVRGVEDRSASLPELIWTARMHILELEAAYNEARHAELEEAQRLAYEEFKRAEKALPIAQRRYQDTLDRSVAIDRERDVTWSVARRRPRKRSRN